jgi:(E)-2-((N-methylformamido)methylene)succinate hydrolase
MISELLEKSTLELVTLPSGRLIEVELFGEGRPCAFIPGLGCTGSLFTPLLHHLPMNRRYVVIHLRGIGASDPAIDRYDIEDLAIDVLFTMNRLGHPCFDVLGVSLGGFVAMALKTLTPWRVESLGLISTTLAGEDYRPLPFLDDFELERFYELDPLVRAIKSVDATVHPLLKTQNPEHYAELLRLRTHPRMKASQVIWQNRAAKSFLARYQDAKLTLASQLRGPILIGSGAHDRFVPVQNARQMAHDMPGAKLHIIDQADHLMVMEKPRELARALTDFWEDCV